MRIAAVLGCGRVSGTKEGWRIGHAHARGYLAARPDVILHGVDPNPENLAAFGETFAVPKERLFASTRELYAARVPEVVSICTWPALHHPMVLEAVEAGVKGILCEKPMALDGSQIDDMLAACARRNVKLAIAHQRAFDPEFILLKDLLRGGAIGQDVVLEARVGDGWDMLSWSVHWIDLASWLFDADAQSVLAGVDHTGQRRYQHAVEDASVVFVEFAGNRQAVFVTGPPVPGGVMVTLRGSDGMMQIRGREVHVFNRSGHSVPPLPKVGLDGFAGMVDEMFRAIDQGTPMRLDARRTARATELAFAAHESARTCRRIALPADIKYPPLEVVQHAPKAPPAAGRVVLLADAHHADPVTGVSGRDGLTQALRDIGVASLTVIEAEKRELTEADLADADVLVVYHTQRKSTPAARAALTRWVNAGKPLAVVHCGIGAYSDWQQFKEWIGLYWVWHEEPVERRSGHPHEPSVLRVVDPAAGLPFVEAWLPRDEVYIKLGQASPVREIVRAEMGGQSWPAAWQSVNHPNVAVWGPGHRPDIWRLPVMHAGLRFTLALVQGAARRP